MFIRKLINRIFWLLPFIILLSLLWLTFYQHPTMDDFAGDLLVKRDGIGKAILLYLKNSNGRFFVVPIFLLLTSTNFFITYYFLLLIIFLILILLGYYYFISNLICFKFNWHERIKVTCWLSSVFFIITLSVMPEPSSFIFWITTGVVYLIPAFLILIYIQLLLIPFKRDKLINNTKYYLLLLLSILLIGSNEVSIFFSFAFILIAAFFYFLIYRKVHKLYLIGIAGQVLFINITFLLPGNLSRSASFSVKQQWYFSVISGFYQALEIIYYLLSNTLFWTGLIVMFLIMPEHDKPRFGISRKYTNLLLHFLIILLLNFCFCFFIRHFTGWVVPERSKNIMVLVTMIYMYLIAYLANPEMGPKLKKLIYSKSNIYKLIFILIVIFNPFSLKLIQTSLLVTTHNDVLNHRVAQIKSAKENDKNSVRFDSYKESFRNRLIQKYNQKVADFVSVEFPIPPELVYFKDEPFDNGLGFMYAEYYEIDSIITAKGTIVR